MAKKKTTNPNGNINLRVSNTQKQDEFYTKLSDIENELKHYRDFFAEKTVFCNCDDPYESNFFKYFAINFNGLKLKKLICTCYGGSPLAGEQLPLFELFDNDSKKESRTAYKVVINHIPDFNQDGAVDLSDVRTLIKSDCNVLTKLEGDGDFRSQECLELLKESDIVVTNPPFSLMKEYIPLMLSYNKKIIVLANNNHITFKEIFPYICRNELWLGYNSGHLWFRVPDYYENKETDFKIENNIKYRRMGNICWFTNIDIDTRHTPLILYKKYNQEDYPTYDNFNAIHVERVEDIPCDYEGIMGVPITYLSKHCKEQFEILGKLDGGTADNQYDLAKPILGGKIKYKRLAIKKKDQTQ